MSRLSFSIVVSMAFLLICNCGSDEPYKPDSQGEQKGTIALKVTWPSKGQVAKIADVEEVSSITAYVNSESGTEITHVDLRHEESRGKAEISVAAGNNYQIVLVAFESDLIKYIGSDDDVDVVAGGTSTAEVTMANAAPVLNSGETTGDNAYKFSWTSSSFAVSYMFEEDVSDSFTSPSSQQTVNLTISYSNKQSGKYYYRVCGVTPYGNSIWSETRTVEVGSNGTITIDVPWPDETLVDVKLSLPDSLLYHLTASYGYYHLYGEVKNSGTKNATNVKLMFIARNSKGTYLDESDTFAIGTVEAGSFKGFDVQYYMPTNTSYLVYTLTCDEGGPFTGIAPWYTE